MHILAFRVTCTASPVLETGRIWSFIREVWSLTLNCAKFAVFQHICSEAVARKRSKNAVSLITQTRHSCTYIVGKELFVGLKSYSCSKIYLSNVDRLLYKEYDKSGQNRLFCVIALPNELQ